MDERPASTQPALLVFADDWGRHPSSCQHLIGQLLADYDVWWVNTIGMRRPGLNTITVRRAAQKLGTWSRRKPGSADAAPDRLHVVNPKMWPWFTRRHDRRLNRSLLLRHLTPLVRSLPSDTVAITTLPIVADLVGKLPVARWVYYCVDDFGTWPGLDQQAMQEMETRLIQRADCIIAASENLQSRLAQLGRQSELLTHGVDLDHWRLNGATAALPEVQQLAKPLVVFWGIIDRRMDVELVRRLAADLSEGTILLVGPEEDPDPELYGDSRIARLPPIDYADLPGLAAAASVLIMPYRDIEVTRAMQPLKLKEYLATGRPAVVRDLPSVAPWRDCLDTITTAEEFSAAVLRRLAAGPSTSHQQALTRLAQESWTSKARQFEQAALFA